MKMVGYRLSEEHTMMLDIISDKTGQAIEDIVGSMIEARLTELRGREFVARVKHREYNEEDFKEEFGYNPTRFY